MARETILADKPANGSSTSDLSRFEPKKSPVVTAARPPSMNLGKGKETLDITMGGTQDEDNAVVSDKKIDQSSAVGDVDMGGSTNVT